MKNIISLLLVILPLNIMGQQLDCCKTVKEVESYLNGRWKKTGGNPNEVYIFQFSNGTGQTKIHTIKHDGSEEINKGSEAAINILKSEKGFILRYDWKHSIIEQQIKHLDSINVTISMGNRNPVTLIRVSEF